MYSTDGIDWTNVTVSGSSSGYSTVIYGNGLYVAWANSGGAGSTTYATSTNGTSWTHRTLSATNVNTIRPSAYGNGTYIGVIQSSAFLVTSTNGTSWTVRSMPSSQNWYSAAYGNGTFFTHSVANTTAATSPDGITWTARTTPEAFRDVKFANGIFVATPNATNSNVYTSTDGITWTTRTLPFSASQQKRVFGGGGVFVVFVDGTSQIATSTDGITWTSRSGAGTDSWQSGAYGANNYVIMANNNNARQYSQHINSSFGIYKPPTTTY
jgi:hypothetical protein